MVKRPLVLSIPLLALVTLAIMLAAPISTPEAQLPPGLVDISFDKQLTITDFIEMRRGEQWEDVIAEAKHTTERSEGGQKLHSQTDLAEISREVYLFENEAAVLWRIEGLTDARTSWRLGLRIPAQALTEAGGADAEAATPNRGQTRVLPTAGKIGSVPTAHRSPQKPIRANSGASRHGFGPDTPPADDGRLVFGPSSRLKLARMPQEPRCRMCLFYGRADQTIDFPLEAPESLLRR
jgi:hypothetical protein